MHPKDCKIKRILNYEWATYNFCVVQDWWKYNPLPHQKEVRHNLKFTKRDFIFVHDLLVCQYISPCILQTHYFNIKVYACKIFVLKFKSWQVAQAYAGVATLDEQDQACILAELEMIRYWPNVKLWHNSRGKDPSFIQCFVDCSIEKKGIVFNQSASIGIPSL